MVKDNNLELYKIVNLRIIDTFENDEIKIEGRASCGCCERDLTIEEAKTVIERLIEEKECDLKFLQIQNKIVNELKNSEGKIKRCQKRPIKSKD